MNLSRRSFLGGVMALTASTALPIRGAFALALPTIWGDGVHDDAPGLNALLQGLPFHVENDDVVAIDGMIRQGTFLIGSTLRPIADRHFIITHNLFKALPSLGCAPILDIPTGAKGEITFNVLVGYAAQRPPVGGFSLAGYENEKRGGKC